MSFWTEDLTVLFSNRQFVNFVPKTNMSEVDKLNAMSRFCIYWMILLVMFSSDFYSFVYIPLVILIVIVAIYYLRKHQILPNTNIFVKENNKLVLHHDDNITDYTDFVSKHPKQVCRLPSKENPYMNNLITEDEPQGCKIYDPEIREQVVDLYHEDLFRDVGDLYDKKSSERQFMTLPYGKDADTVGFANWLYNSPNSDKQRNTL